MTYKIYTDGGARGNPGPSAIGVVIMNENDEIIYELSSYLGEGTNNQAEYAALLKAMEIAKEKNIKNVKAYLDSLLIVKQLGGDYKIKNAQLEVYFKKIKDLEKHFEDISYNHVRREYNKKADSLVNKALDNHGK